VIKIANNEQPIVVLIGMKLRREMDGVKPAKEICSRFGIPAIFAIAGFAI